MDSHFDLPVINKSLDAIRRTELVSFREAIRAGTDAVMSAHIVFPALEPDGLPATISARVLSDLLRKQLGFSGLIVSDGMEMKAMLNLFPIPEGVFRALKAGVDIALVCHEPALAAASCLRIEEGLKSGMLSAENLSESCQRIAARKATLPTAGPARDFLDPQDQETAGRIMRQAVRLVHAPDGKPLPAADNRTLFWGRPSRRPSPAMDGGFLNAADLFAKHFASPFRFNGSEEKPYILPETAVFFLRKGEHLEEDQREAARLAGLGARVVCVALDTPYVLEKAPRQAWQIQAWQYQTLALDAVCSLLGQGSIQGRS